MDAGGAQKRWDTGRARSFGADADRYDRTRPSYPAELFDDVLGADGTALRVLDVGCGTGIAARLMAARGASVLGVEVDPRMAEVARLGGTEVEVAAFEHWDAAGRSFDRVTAGQAWHWVDPVAGAARAAAILVHGGRLCPFWNVAKLPEDLDGELSEVYANLAPGADCASVVAGKARESGYLAEAEGMRMCPDLSDPVVRHFHWSREYTRDEWLDQLPTHSDHAALPAEVLGRVLDHVGRVIDRFGGAFTMSYQTLLLSATRR